MLSINKEKLPFGPSPGIVKLREGLLTAIPQDIPYTVAAEKYKAEEFVGSAEATLQVKEKEKAYADVRLRPGPNTPKIQLNGVDVMSDRVTVASGIYEVF